jgi:hypothetical protein
MLSIDQVLPPEYQSTVRIFLFHCIGARCFVNFHFDRCMADFARILALRRASKSTIPTRHRPAAECKECLCIVGLVDLLAQLSANIRAKRGYSTSFLAL